MTFVLVEILQQAFMQISSSEFRRRHGEMKLQACARESDCDMPHGDAARRADKAAPVCR